MLRKQYIITISLGIFIMLSIAFVQKTPANEGEKPTFIQPSQQRGGDSLKGYNYLVTGDYLKSGFR